MDGAAVLCRCPHPLATTASKSLPGHLQLSQVQAWLVLRFVARPYYPGLTFLNLSSGHHHQHHRTCPRTHTTVCIPVFSPVRVGTAGKPESPGNTTTAEQSSAAVTQTSRLRTDHVKRLSLHFFFIFFFTCLLLDPTRTGPINTFCPLRVDAFLLPARGRIKIDCPTAKRLMVALHKTSGGCAH